jgi:hypothetical protein
MPWASLGRPVGAGMQDHTRVVQFTNAAENRLRKTTQRFEAKPPHKGHRRGAVWKRSASAMADDTLRRTRGHRARRGARGCRGERVHRAGVRKRRRRGRWRMHSTRTDSTTRTLRTLRTPRTSRLLKLRGGVFCFYYTGIRNHFSNPVHGLGHGQSPFLASGSLCPPPSL